MKAKRIIAAILACTFICKVSLVTEVSYRFDSFITASAATEESGTLGENITWELDDNGTLTISGSGDIPSDLSQLYNEEIKSIVINNGITTIGDMAFANFKNLTSVILSDSITNIGYAAFYSCKNLTSITIPDSVISIGFDVFYDTPWLEEQRKNNPLVIVNGILIDGYSCEGDVTIPNDVTSINVSAFSDCDNLTSIIIPDSVTSIGASAFSGCKNLTSITIPDSVTSIGDYAFNDIPWLEEQRKKNPLVIINGILIDGYSCEGDVIIPNSVTSIGVEAFSNCKSLTSITIPDSVTSIDGWAFYDCTSLESITIENSECAIGDSLGTIPDTSTIYGYTGSTAQAYADKYQRKFVAIGDKPVTTTPPTTTTTLTTTTTTTKKTTTAIATTTATTTTTRPNVNGLEYRIENDGTVTITKYIGTDSYIEIPSVIEGKTVSSIGRSSFEENMIIKEVVLPDTITSVYYDAFLNCKNLESINFPKSLKNIYDYAFTTCHRLKSIDLTNVTHIGYGAFQLCISLSEVTVPGTIKNIPDHAFHGCSDVNILTFEEGVTTIKEDAALNMYSLDEIIIPASVSSIGEHALGFTYYHPNYTRLDLTIVGYSGTAAEEYANKYGFNFRSLGIGTNITTSTTPVTTTNSSTTTTKPVTITTTTITTTKKPATTTTTKSTTTSTSTTTTTSTITTTPTTSELALGDVDNNKNINAIDASMILAEYAIIATNGTPNFTEEQMKAADVNDDGEVNAIDASLVLAYYAHVSTGGKLSLKDFISNKT